MMRMQLGQVVMTRGISEAAKKDKEFAEFVACYLEMYIDRDWGDTCADDAYANDDAMEKGDARVVAKYNHIFRNIFIITEWDRSVTTILFCHEY